MFQYFVNVWNAIVAFLASNGPMAILSAVAGVFIGITIVLYVSHLERMRVMRSSDEIGELASAMWEEYKREHEIELIVGKASPSCGLPFDRGHQPPGEHCECVPATEQQAEPFVCSGCPGGWCGGCVPDIFEDEDARLESSAQRWQESQADQDYWQRRAAEGGHARDCDCPECCGGEPPEEQCTGCENGCDQCLDPLMTGYIGCYHKDSEECNCAEEYRKHQAWVHSSNDSDVCTCSDCRLEQELGPEAVQAMNAFRRQQANEPTWQERERQAEFDRRAYCGWEEF